MANKQPTKAQLEEENDYLKKEIQNTQSQMAALQQQIAQLMQMQTSAQNAVVQNVNANVNSDRNITFVNMINGTAVLRGSQIWTIEGQFNSRGFTIREARIIVNNMNRFIREGHVFITDAEFVEENDLADAYKTIISDKDLKNLLTKNVNEVVNIYKTVPEGQKEIIIRMIIDRKLNDKYVDANIVAELGKLSGKNLLGIEPLEDEE